MAVVMDEVSESKEFSFVLAGKLGVGKSSIFRRIQSGTFSEIPSGGSGQGRPDGELEHHIYHTTLNDEDYSVSSS